MSLTQEEIMQRGQLNRGNISIERIDHRLLSGEKFYLFNIYSNEYSINLGTCGQWLIPACPEDQEYVRAPQVIPGTFEDIYPHFNEREEFRSRAIPGEDIVKAILGLDRPQENITHYGVFASKNEVPTKQELAAAKKKLIPQLQKEIASADKMFASPTVEDRQSVFDNKFMRAARYLNVKKPWLSEAAEMSVCPFCSSAVRPEAPKCGNCHEVINVPAYEALKASLAGAK